MKKIYKDSKYRLSLEEQIMKKIWKRIVAGILIFTVMISVAACSKGNNTPKNQSLDAMIEQSAKALQKNLTGDEAASAGSPTGDWTAIAYAFAGQNKACSNYLQELENYITKQYRKKGNLSDVKATEYHRAALTILALGGDPADIEKKGEHVNLIADGTWNFPGGSPGLQGANGLIYALLMLDSRDYETAQPDLRSQYVEELLTYQKDSGAFCIDNSLDGDVDITAMAPQALAKYRGEGQVNTAVQKALSWLEDQMTEDAVFKNSDSESAESSAQVILALCALGEDPDKDEQFQKNGRTVLDGLNDYRMKDGMYMHESSEKKENIMATYQSLLALEAVQELREEQKWIFDFTEE